MTRLHDKKQVKGGLFGVVALRMHSVWPGKHTTGHSMMGEQVTRTPHHLKSPGHTEHRERNAGNKLACSLSIFPSIWDSQPMGWRYPHSGWTSLLSYIFGRILIGAHKRSTLSILQVLLIPIKLTLKFKYLWYFWCDSRNVQSVSVVHFLFVSLCL